MFIKCVKCMWNKDKVQLVTPLWKEHEQWNKNRRHITGKLSRHDCKQKIQVPASSAVLNDSSRILKSSKTGKVKVVIRMQYSCAHCLLHNCSCFCVMQLFLCDANCTCSESRNWVVFLSQHESAFSLSVLYSCVAL